MYNGISNYRSHKSCKKRRNAVILRSRDKMELEIDKSAGQKRIISLDLDLKLDPTLVENKSQSDSPKSVIEHIVPVSHTMNQNRIIKFNDCVPINPKNSREFSVNWTEESCNSKPKHELPKSILKNVKLDNEKNVFVKESDKRLEKSKKVSSKNVASKPLISSINLDNIVENHTLLKKKLVDPNKKPDQTFILIPRTAVNSMQGQLSKNSPLPEKISIDLTSKVPVTFKEIALQSLEPKPSQLSSAIQKVFNIQQSRSCSPQHEPKTNNSKPFVIKVKPANLKSIKKKKKLDTKQKNNKTRSIKTNVKNRANLVKGVSQKIMTKNPIKQVELSSTVISVIKEEDPEVYPVALKPSESSYFQYISTDVTEDSEMQILGI